MTNTVLAAITVGCAYLLLILTCLLLLKKAKACLKESGKVSYKLVLFIFWIGGFSVLALSVLISGTNVESQHTKMVELLNNVDKTYNQSE
jgi:hypothetical protein